MRIEQRPVDIFPTPITLQDIASCSMEFAGKNTGQTYNAGKHSLSELVEKCNKALSENETHIQVKIHDKTNTIMVMVVRNDTEEVIREIPSEKMLDMMYNICIRTGVFFDEKM
ncbi:flagellar protein FlaG [Paenibacillus taiwanensis]|uniref:flagellar protein FlaG n=1 Tax=Paenibacillus taiwanensis TaxID=401638 RepID=UPI0006869654|nr:flagellar protein FlaG [Paenibacillus taiwanensis]